MPAVSEFDADEAKLVLETLEFESQVLEGHHAWSSYPPQALALLNRGVLVKYRIAQSVLVMDDYEHELVPAVMGEDGLTPGYIDAVCKWTPVRGLQAYDYKLNLDIVFEGITRLMPRSRGRVQRALVPGVLWDLGSFELPGQAKAIDIWFAPRFWEAEAFSLVCQYIDARPSLGQRVVLTSSCQRHVPKANYKAHEFIAVADLLTDGSGLAVLPDILGARLRSFDDGQTITFDYDSGVVRQAGKTYHFRGAKHKEALRILFDAYQAGRPQVRTAALLAEIEAAPGVNTLTKLFSGRSDWRDFVDEADGICQIGV